jgi:hypothetical protein
MLPGDLPSRIMKRHALLFALLSLTAQAQNGGNLIMNGGFEAGIQFWKGDGKVERLPDGGRVCEIEAARNRLKDITQEFRMKGMTQVEIVFRARAIKYTGAALRISVHQPGGGSIIYNRDLPPDGSWKDFRLNYLRPNAEERRELIIATMVGTGSVQIDDVEVRPPTQLAQAADTPPEPPRPMPATPVPTTPTPATPSPLAMNRPAPLAPAVVMIPAPPPRPAHSVPAGTFGSIEQMLQTIPPALFKKLEGGSTDDAALAEINTYLATTVKGHPGTLRARVERNEPTPGVGKRVRYKAPDTEISLGGVTLKHRVWIYYPEMNMPELSQIAPGAEPLSSGTIGRCELTNKEGGLRLNVDLQQSRFVEP